MELNKDEVRRKKDEVGSLECGGWRVELNKDEVRRRKEEVEDSQVVFLACERACTNELLGLRAGMHE